jgi:DNA-binding transcriptional LysR family regulator
MQDLNDMLYFAEVVERGGFAAAGRALGIPKSRLSRRVAELEATLGVRLLQRTTRRIALTEVGEAYLRHCQSMREAAEAASDLVASVQTAPRGTVRVSCPVTLAQTVLAELMPRFLAQNPQVRMDMQITNRAVNLLEDGFDVALRVRSTLEDSGSMVVKRLDDSRSLMVASPQLLQRQGTPRTLEDLPALDWLAMSASEGRTSLRLIGPGGREHVLHISPRYIADDLLTLKFAALGGAGICWLPDYMCHEEVRAGQLVELLPGWMPPRGIVHAVFPSRRGLSPAVRAFLDFLGEHMPGRSRLPDSVCAELGALNAGGTP